MGVPNPLELGLGEKGGNGKNSDAWDPYPDQRDQNFRAV